MTIELVEKSYVSGWSQYNNLLGTKYRPKRVTRTTIQNSLGENKTGILRIDANGTLYVYNPEAATASFYGIVAYIVA